jgi:RNA methyltransferase, TrmH family
LPLPGIRNIESSTNSLVKVFRHALNEGVTREGWIAFEGPLLLEEALHASTEGSEAGRCRIQTVLASRTAAEKFARLIERLPKEAELAQVPDGLFDRLTQTESPQGIAALVELPEPSLDAVLAGRGPCLLAACGVQDPGNLGSMMRSVQALGGSALLALRDTVSPFNPKTLRSSAGAIFRVPVFRNLESGDLLPRLRSAGITVIAADRRSPTSLTQADLRGGVAFLIGREGGGLDQTLLDEATQRLSIPIRADADSVNAGVAASIFLYEAARQRGFKY